MTKYESLTKKVQEAIADNWIKYEPIAKHYWYHENQDTITGKNATEILSDLVSDYLNDYNEKIRESIEDQYNLTEENDLYSYLMDEVDEGAGTHVDIYNQDLCENAWNFYDTTETALTEFEPQTLANLLMYGQEQAYRELGHDIVNWIIEELKA